MSPAWKSAACCNRARPARTRGSVMRRGVADGRRWTGTGASIGFHDPLLSSVLDLQRPGCEALPARLVCGSSGANFSRRRTLSQGRGLPRRSSLQRPVAEASKLGTAPGVRPPAKGSRRPVFPPSASQGRGTRPRKSRHRCPCPSRQGRGACPDLPCRAVPRISTQSAVDTGRGGPFTCAPENF